MHTNKLFLPAILLLLLSCSKSGNNRNLDESLPSHDNNTENLIERNERPDNTVPNDEAVIPKADSAKARTDQGNTQLAAPEPRIDARGEAMKNVVEAFDGKNNRLLTDELAEFYVSRQFVPCLYDGYALGSLGQSLRSEILSFHRHALQNNDIDLDKVGAIFDKVDNDENLVNSELILMRNWLRLASALALSNPNAVTRDEEIFLKNNSMRKLVSKRIVRHLEKINTLCMDAPQSKIEELILSTHPSGEQYPKLLEAYERYLNMPNWEKISKFAIKNGAKGEKVRALKQRLAIERYFVGDIDNDVCDDECIEAVDLYMKTHQISRNKQGNVPPSFWNSLNVSRTQRVKVIEENLRRWHRTYLFPSPYFVYINVPDFHGELWKDNRLVRRFAVVVGNAKKICNRSTSTWILQNATPLMHAKMSYLDFNPYWVVPGRIESQEYKSKIDADPTWLERNGFEYHVDKNGSAVFRQTPGEHNALGQVKFIFPNPHATFMHDTPKKKLFKYPTRAFSHGCMRVENPMELAKDILENEGKWDKKLEKDIDDMVTRRVLVGSELDVFIDYFTVRVDENGHMHFLADPYKYVKNALENKPQNPKCNPAPLKKTTLGAESQDDGIEPAAQADVSDLLGP